MLPQISVLSTSLIDYLRKTEFPSLASKPVLLAGFILSGLDSGHLLDQCILTLVIRTILFLSGPGLLSPIRDSLQSVYDGLRTRIYTEQISASLQFWHGLDSCVLG
jgi:hypothetical protein